MGKTTQKIPASKVRKVAAEADADPRTVRKILDGGKASGSVDERVRNALRAAGLLLAVFLVGCAGEGATAQPGETEAGPGAARGGGSIAFTGTEVQTKTAVTVATTTDAGATIQADTRPAVTVTVTTTTTVTPDAGTIAAPDTRPADTRTPDTMPAVQPDTRIADTLAPGPEVNPMDPSGGKAANDAGWNGYAASGMCPQMEPTSATDPTLRCVPRAIEPFCDVKTWPGCLPASQYYRCLKACP